MDVSALTRQISGSWLEELAADYETSQARLSWILDSGDSSEEFI
ncbi:hypothetical protein [Georgenia sp. H159]|jgi:hypothetical protein|nr:hypothetical protein [Georgenia sp. H159]